MPSRDHFVIPVRLWSIYHSIRTCPGREGRLRTMKHVDAVATLR
jgi:hypothetical protein